MVMSKESLEAAMHAFRELALTPGTTIDMPAFAGSPAFVEMARQEELRKSTDWAFLEKYRDDNVALRRGTRPTVVFIGSSITENWLQADPSFFSDGPVNRGIGGQTSAHLLVRFAADVVRIEPRAVHLMVGANDIAGNAGEVSDEDFHNNITSMADIASAHGIQLILGSIPPTTHIPWRPDVEPAPRIATFNKWLRTFAIERDAIYADYFTVLADQSGGLPQSLSNDGVHPNRLGYELMRPVAERAIAATAG